MVFDSSSVAVMLRVRGTHDHHMTLQNGDYRRACQLQLDDLVCATESEGEVAVIGSDGDFARVSDGTFEEDRPILMALQDPSIGMAVGFGSH